MPATRPEAKVFQVARGASAPEGPPPVLAEGEAVAKMARSGGAHESAPLQLKRLQEMRGEPRLIFADCVTFTVNDDWEPESQEVADAVNMLQGRFWKLGSVYDKTGKLFCAVFR